MATASIEKKRKNIDLPVDVMRTLGIVAVRQGQSLKAFIESLCKREADKYQISLTENPSPSKDPWFDDPENIKAVAEGIEEYHKGKGREYSLEEIHKMLGV